MAPSVVAPNTNGVPKSSTKAAENNTSQPAIKQQSGGDLKTRRDEQYKEHSAAFNAQYALSPRKLRIITIGAGFSGLLIAHKFQHRFPELQDFVEHTIFEGRSDLGGTWLVNTYPGVQCDVPSHIYVSLVSQAMNERLVLTSRHSHSIRIQTGRGFTRVGRRFTSTSRKQRRNGIWGVMCS